jgi:hypothetical protein
LGLIAIAAGDLHPNYSTHVLLPLKVVYKKLRLLVDLGCIFVGHGLSKDFRIISMSPDYSHVNLSFAILSDPPDIFVPPERVMDTVDIYYIPERGRRLSLRFLTYTVFKQEIQVDTHDSIEDARAALLLHRTFQEREAEGTFDELLREIYTEGKKLVSWPACNTNISDAVIRIGRSQSQLNPRHRPLYLRDQPSGTTVGPSFKQWDMVHSDRSQESFNLQG